jgi:hypothetical protein
VNKSRLHLVEGKINWHKTTGMGGGICDMTLCYIITEEGLVENVKDTNDIIMLDGEQCVFDHNISVSYGFSGENTFVQDPRRLKMITKKDGKYYAKTTTGSDVRLLSMHFSGGAKQVLTSLDENGFF